MKNSAMVRAQKPEGFPGQRIVVLPRSVVAQALKHPLLDGLCPTDVGYFPKASGHLRERTVGIDQAIFIFCTNGGGWCELDGRRHEVKRGELLVVPPLQPHTYGANATQPWTIHWFHAVGEKLPHLLKELGATADAPVLFLGDAPHLLGLFEEVLATLEHGYAPVHLLYASHALTHLVGAMIRQRHERWIGDPDSNQKITQSIAYMKSHVSRPLTVTTLAALASLSPSHYTALFKDQTGYSPIDYLIRLRMHQACQLLDTTTLSVKEIASRLGYEDPFYFSRLFKSVNEISPADYRLMHKG